MLLILLLLSGCGLTTKTLVDFSKSRNKIGVIRSEIYDDLQVCIWGIKTNESLEARDAFVDVALEVLGEPSVEEKLFSRNATLKEINLLKIETVGFVKLERDLSNRLDSIEIEITEGHDEDRSMVRMIIKYGIIAFGIISILAGAFFVLLKLKSISGFLS